MFRFAWLVIGSVMVSLTFFSTRKRNPIDSNADWLTRFAHLNLQKLMICFIIIRLNSYKLAYNESIKGEKSGLWMQN